MGVRVGAGLARSDCADCRDGGRKGGFIGGVSVAVQVSPRLRLALDVDGWVNPLNGGRTTSGVAS